MVAPHTVTCNVHSEQGAEMRGEHLACDPSHGKIEDPSMQAK